MNVRNLSFVIVLVLVWLIGYYYYSPERLTICSAEEHNKNIQMPVQQHLEEQINKEAAPITHRTEDPTSALKSEALPEIISTIPVKKTEPALASKQIKKKKRTRKEKNKLAASPATDKFIPEQQQTNHHEGFYTSSPSNNQTTKDPINITTDLKKKDIGYYKMLSWHYPHLFKLTVNNHPLFTKNDKIISQAEPITIAKNMPFVIRYDYEWHTPWGKRIGAKKVTFKANSDAQNLVVRFMSNWKNEERIVVDGATKVSAELLEEIRS